MRLRAGYYRVRDPGGLLLARPRVTLRSRSGDPRGVVLDGGYGPSALARVAASGITIAEVTLIRAADHLVHAVPPEGQASIKGLRLHRVRLVDSGEQFVKANPNGSRTGWVHRSRVECSSFRMTAAGRRNIERAFGCYTGGIDAHGAHRWRVRRNRFEGIYCEDGEVAEHAVHFWRRSRDTLVENNLILNCARGIGFGLTGDAGDGHTDGVIRRNAVVADIRQYDTGIELANAANVRVLHNTVAETGRAANAFSSLDVRFPRSSGLLANNLVERISSETAAAPGGSGTSTASRFDGCGHRPAETCTFARVPEQWTAGSASPAPAATSMAHPARLGDPTSAPTNLAAEVWAAGDWVPTIRYGRTEHRYRPGA